VRAVGGSERVDVEAGLPAIVLYGLCPWDYIKNRPQQLAQQLGEHTHVYYLEPPIAARELLPDLGALLRHIASPLVTAREVTPGVTAITTRYRYPFSETVAAIDRRNRTILGRAVDSVVRRDGRPPVLWLMHPAGAGLMDFVGHCAVVYDLVDRHLDFSSQGAARLREVAEGEKRLFAEADAVTATAHSLVDYARESGARRVEYLPNACDPEHFRPAVRDPRRTDAPVIVFVGAIGEWFDADAVRSVAEALPSARVRLAGPLHDLSDRLPDDLPGNVEYVGRIAFDSLPEFLHEADLALIPFKVNALTSSVNPVKLFEYLAAGKPVVSTPLPEVASFAPLVEIAESGEFGNAVKRALAADTPAAVARRLDVARQNSWRHRAADALRLMAELTQSDDEVPTS